jgi:hypothetical protein
MVSMSRKTPGKGRTYPGALAPWAQTQHKVLEQPNRAPPLDPVLMPQCQYWTIELASLLTFRGDDVTTKHDRIFSWRTRSLRAGDVEVAYR